ncbi:MAG: hypothetical protein Q7T03_01210 [Deltaproteobacteria bacterium]|nr:hypothetical protein [Deltaproteobacteria bacterium]
MTIGGGADDPRKQSVQPVGAHTKGIDDIRLLIAQEQNLEKEVVQEKKPATLDTLVQISRDIPRLIQKSLQKVDASLVYQTFKLPGSDYTVHDNREGKGTVQDKVQTIADESRMSLDALLIKKGKYENFFADPSQKIKVPEQKAAEERLQKLFNRFEKILLQRFEKGTVLEQKSEGRFSFLNKTADQWRNFFGHFTKRTVKRHVALEAVGEWTYRGLVKKDSKTTLISDLALINGKTEKFVRIRLSEAAQNLAARLASLEPGIKFSADELMECFTEELEYLAIKQGETSLSWVQAPTKGKFLGTAQAEEKVALDLGLQLSAQLKEKELAFKKMGRGKKGSGGFAGLEEENPSEEGGAFVPWFQMSFGKKTGPMKWFVPVFYFVVIAALILGVLSLLSF